MNLKHNNTGVPGLGVEYQFKNEPDATQLGVGFH